MAKLTEKQEMFCREYLIDLNARQAAIRAGYSEKTASEMGYENLSKPHIAEKIAEFKQERVNNTKIDAEWVLKSAKQVFDRCMQHEELDEAEGGTRVFKFEHAGANKALDIIGKHVDVQAFKDRVEQVTTHKLDKPLVERLTGGSKR